jgi:hypothetical protein
MTSKGLNLAAKPFVPGGGSGGSGSDVESSATPPSPPPKRIIVGSIRQPQQQPPSTTGNRLVSMAQEFDHADSPLTNAAAMTRMVELVSRLPAACTYPHTNLPGTFYDHLSIPRNSSRTQVCAAFVHWRDEGFPAANAVDPAKAQTFDRIIMTGVQVLTNELLHRAYDDCLVGASS